MPFKIVRQDITKMKVDAVVNAANAAQSMGDAIFSAAGADKLQAACKNVAPIQTGCAAITSGFDLPAKYIIHTAGPIYAHWSKEENEKLLYSSYAESLTLALTNGCKSICFPLISSGSYGYPMLEALKVATAAIKDFLAENDMKVYLTIFDKESFAVSEELLGEVKSYVDENYVERHYILRENSVGEDVECYELSCSIVTPKTVDSLSYIMDELDEPFSTILLRLIEAKGKTNAEIYKRANIDRKLFSKIINGKKSYIPGKRTVIALAIALELGIDEARDFLEKAGFAISHNQKFDLIIEYFIKEGKYDIYEINEVLFKYDQPLLGSN